MPVLGGFKMNAQTDLRLENNRALLRAAEEGHSDRVRRLISGNLLDIDTKDSQGRSALLLATWKNHVEIAQMLMQAGADVNAQDKIYDSPYLVAGAEGRYEILKLSLEYGADLKSLNRYGGTALIPACEKGHPRNVELLLRAGVDVNHVNRLGWTCLLEITILGEDREPYWTIVKMLLEANADINITDKNGLHALDHARKRQLSTIEKILIEALENPHDQ
ncbi:unnamed protein product [Darwinula stevensoni]|uniref:Ankyrin repeat domain-containing protein n=1 Tax=Darwinula stevensoni TaxID=69355 RepID=A0A7R8X7A6_9CRUS|nr:unnamed protein product [Darwinula stevensoni]CAG0888945.1 unnamed protein product [Darwinula stevensoni]